MASASPHPPNELEIIERAQALIELKRYSQAVDLLGGYAAADAPPAAVLALLSQALIGEDRTLEAVEAAESACRAEPQEAYTHRLLASALLSTGRLRDAVRSAEEAVSLAPEDAANHRVLAFCLIRVQRFRPAEEAAERAARLDPQNANSHVALAAVQLARADSGARWKPGSIKKAHAHATKAVELDPHNSDAINLLGGAQRGRGHLLQATATHLAVLHADPHDQVALRHIGRLLLTLLFVTVMGTFIFTMMNPWVGLVDFCLFAVILGLVIRKLPRGGTRMALASLLGQRQRR